MWIQPFQSVGYFVGRLNELKKLGQDAHQISDRSISGFFERARVRCVDMMEQVMRVSKSLGKTGDCFFLE